MDFGDLFDERMFPFSDFQEFTVCVLFVCGEKGRVLGYDPSAS